MLSKPYLELALDFSRYRFIAKPCALHVGIQDSGPYPNAILEKVFLSITKVSGQRKRKIHVRGCSTGWGRVESWYLQG